MGNCNSSASTGDAPQFSDLNGNPPAKQTNKQFNKNKQTTSDDSENLNGTAQRYIVKITSHEEEKQSENQSNNQLIVDENELSRSNNSFNQSNQSTTGNQSINQSESAPMINSIAQNHQSIPPSGSPPIQSINQSNNQSSTTQPTSPPIKKKLDPKDFMIANKTGETIIRNNQSINPSDPPPIDGQSFAIEYCSDCTICLIDWIGQLTIDDCSNCTFLIGPIESSIFIRNCTNCYFIVSCQQIRIRDCTDLSISLLVSASQPVMESSTDIKFMGYTVNFIGLRDLLHKAGLNEWDTQWSNVHDFFSQSINQSNNQSEKQINYSYLPHNPMLITDRIKHLLVDQSNNQSNDQSLIQVGEQMVPFTWGNRPIDQSNNQSVLVLADASKSATIWKLIQSLQLDNHSISQSIDNPYKLIRTKIMQGKVLSNNQTFIKQLIDQSINQSTESTLIGKSIVGLEFNGPDMSQIISQFISQSHLDVAITKANTQSIEQFFASPQI